MPQSHEMGEPGAAVRSDEESAGLSRRTVLRGAAGAGAAGLAMTALAGTALAGPAMAASRRETRGFPVAAYSIAGRMPREYPNICPIVISTANAAANPSPKLRYSAAPNAALDEGSATNVRSTG